MRNCTKKQNSVNRGNQKNKSGFRGVYKPDNRKTWRVMIRVNGKLIHVGCYENKIKAIQERKKAEMKYFGKYARIF